MMKVRPHLQCASQVSISKIGLNLSLKEAEVKGICCRGLHHRAPQEGCQMDMVLSAPRSAALAVNSCKLIDPFSAHIACPAQPWLVQGAGKHLMGFHEVCMSVARVHHWILAGVHEFAAQHCCLWHPLQGVGSPLQVYPSSLCCFCLCCFSCRHITLLLSLPSTYYFKISAQAPF